MDKWFNGLLSEFVWDTSATSVISYSFPQDSAYYRQGYGHDEWNRFTGLQSAQIEAFESVLSDVERFTQLQFERVEDGQDYGTLRIAFTELDGKSGGWAYYPSAYWEEGGDIWLNSVYANDDMPSESWLYRTLIHELGHALGLSHSFETSGIYPILAESLDTDQYTQMSYTHSDNYRFDTYPSTFMPADIAALQHLYGINTQSSRADNQYQFTDQTAIQTVWDSGGSDGFDFSSVSGAVTVNLGQGLYSSIGNNMATIAIAYGTDIEELRGSEGSDTLIMNGLDNVVWAGSGDDRIETLIAGDDYIDGGAGADTVVLAGNRHSWLWSSSANSDFVLSDSGRSIELVSVEWLEFADQSLARDQLLQQQADDNSWRIIEPDAVLWDNALTATAGMTINAEQAQVYRVYLGGLGRVPDTQGFEWWVNEVAQGTSLDGLAAGFYYSEEFQRLADVDGNGDLSSVELLDHLYRNVLGREPDPEGYAWWQRQIDDHGYDPAQVLTEFTQSNEYIQTTLLSVSNFDFLV